MAKKKIQEPTSELVVDSSIDGVVNDLIPVNTVNSNISDPKVSKADLVNIVASGILDAMTTMHSKINTEIHDKRQQITKELKAQEPIIKELVRKALKLDKDAGLQLNYYNKNLSFTIIPPAIVEEVKNIKLTLTTSSISYNIDIENENIEAINEEISRLEVKLNSINNTIRRASDKKYIQAQIDRAFLARSPNGERMNDNLNNLTNQLLDKMVKDFS